MTLHANGFRKRALLMSSALGAVCAPPLMAQTQDEVYDVKIIQLETQTIQLGDESGITTTYVYDGADLSAEDCAVVRLAGANATGCPEDPMFAVVPIPPQETKSTADHMVAALGAVGSLVLEEFGVIGPKPKLVNPCPLQDDVLLLNPGNRILFSSECQTRENLLDPYLSSNQARMKYISSHEQFEQVADWIKEREIQFYNSVAQNDLRDLGIPAARYPAGMAPDQLSYAMLESYVAIRVSALMKRRPTSVQERAVQDWIKRGTGHYRYLAKVEGQRLLQETLEQGCDWRPPTMVATYEEVMYESCLRKVNAFSIYSTDTYGKTAPTLEMYYRWAIHNLNRIFYPFGYDSLDSPSVSNMTSKYTNDNVFPPDVISGMRPVTAWPFENVLLVGGSGASVEGSSLEIPDVLPSTGEITPENREIRIVLADVMRRDHHSRRLPTYHPAMVPPETQLLFAAKEPLAENTLIVLPSGKIFNTGPAPVIASTAIATAPATATPTVTAALTRASGQTYLFYADGSYARSSAGVTQGFDANYPETMPGGWRGIPQAWHSSINAAIARGGGTINYMWSDGDYVRLNEVTVDANYPQAMPGGWRNMPAHWNGEVDAGFYFKPNGKHYLFKGDEYVRLSDVTVDAGYPQKLPGGWRGMPAHFLTGIDAATFRNGHAYMIKGDEYIRFTGTQMDAGYPKNMSHWPE